MKTKRSLLIAGLVAGSTIAAMSTMPASATTPPTTPGSSSMVPATPFVLPDNTTAELNASGATFPKAFYEEMIANFTEAHGSVTINYLGGGSGKGRQDLADQIVDWAGTDGTINARSDGIQASIKSITKRAEARPTDSSRSKPAIASSSPHWTH